MNEETKRKALGAGLAAGAALQSYEVRDTLSALAIAALLIVPGSLLVAGGVWYWRWALKVRKRD